VPELPSNWKQDWNPSDFDLFPNPAPWMPPTSDSPPDHVCLEKVVQHILS